MRVKTLGAGTSPEPSKAVYLALHQDYFEGAVAEEVKALQVPGDATSADIILDRLLSGSSLHAGPLEHANLQLNFCYIPHSVMQQLRTHRTGITFDVQSFRYTGERIKNYLLGKYSFDDIFYLRQPGSYTDRESSTWFNYTTEMRDEDIAVLQPVIHRYVERVDQGASREQARSMLPFDTRQSWVMSANARTIMHLLDMRWPADAQFECRQVMDLMFAEFALFMPQIADWYLRKRARKSMLSF